MRVIHALTLTVAALLLGACGGGSNSTSEGSLGVPTDTSAGNGATGTPPPTAFHAMFNVGAAIFPYPTDIYLTGSIDGALNTPNLGVLTPNVTSVNALDGFGLTGEITVRFSAPIKAATLAAPGAVTVLETQMLTLTTGTTVARIPIGVRRPMIPGVDYTVGLSSAIDSGGTILSITPLHPLTPSTGGVTFDPANPPPGLPPGSLDASGVGYLVILTGAIQATDGSPALPDNDYATIRNAIGVPNPANPTAGCAAILNVSLQQLCGLTAPHLLIAAGAGIPLQSIALTFSFTTESTRDTLVDMATAIQAAATPPPLAAQGLPNGAGGILNTKNLNPALPGIADVYEGTITIPYYLETPADATAANPFPLLNGQFLSPTAVSFAPGMPGTNTVTRYNPVAAVQHMVTIPVLITIPNIMARPAGGWPVAIFVHAIGGNRSNALAIADAFASAGIAVAAIDLPLHGILPTDSTAALRLPGVQERTFDADDLNNATFQPPGDGQIDPSGFNMLAAVVLHPVTGRDDGREAVLDELELASALAAPTTVIVGASGPVPAPFNPSKISVTGQSLGSMVSVGVASLPSSINSFGLSVPGGSITDILLNSASPFLSAPRTAIAQQTGPDTVLFQQFFRDVQASFDAADPINHMALAVANKPILLHKVVGDGTVPNLATDNLIALGGLTKANAVGPWPAGSYVTFTAGDHVSLLDFAVPAVTLEMQKEMVTFAASGGAGFQIFDASNIQP